MIVGYARVSSAGQNLEVQLEQLAEAGAEKVFEEKQSGRTANDRPQLGACLEFVREGDLLVVTRLDRLARSIRDLRDILDRLESKGVGFRCLLQPVDTTTAEGRLLLNLLGAFAEFEADLSKGRQQEGIARAKAEGLYSRPRPEIRKVTTPQIVALAAQGLGVSEIAKELKVDRKTIYRNSPHGLWTGIPGVFVKPRERAHATR